MKLCGGNAFYARHPFGVCIDAHRRLALKKTAIWPLAAHLWIDQYGYQDLTPILRHLSEADIQPEILMPSVYQYSLCAPEGSAQQLATESYYDHCLKAARKLSIPLICVDARGGCIDENQNIRLERFALAVGALVRKAEDAGIKVLVQSLPPWEASFGNTFAEIRDVVDRSGAGVALDIAAAYSAGETIETWFDALGDRIAHVRLLDGRNSGYRVWGQGVYPARATVEALVKCGYTGCLGLQALTDRYDAAPEAAEAVSVQRLREVLGSL